MLAQVPFGGYSDGMMRGDALHLIEIMGSALDGADDDPESFAIADRPDATAAAGVARRPTPCVGVGLSRGDSDGDVRLALRAWTADDARAVQDTLHDRYGVGASELDIVVTGEIFAAPSTPPAPTPSQLQAMRRPVHPGVSIGHFKTTAGTLGALVEVIVNGVAEQRMLSNNHVLANSISTLNPRAGAKGDPILQQGPSDAGVPPPVGWLDYCQPLRLNGNVADVALASCDLSVGWDPALPGVGRIAGMAKGDPALSIVLEKIGRTTQRTRGTASAFPLRALPVKYRGQIFRFDRVLEVKGQDGAPFSLPGDSGALVFDDQKTAIGMIFAGTKRTTYVNPITDVRREAGFERVL